MSRPAVEVRSLSKVYALYGRSFDRLVEMLTLGRVKRRVEHWALRDVSFEVAPGEVLGIIGSNGAGKSTLLKVLSGISTPTSGGVHVSGHISSLLDLAAGFMIDFTGRDNVFLNASILGFSRAETARLYDEIVAFSELGEFIHQPIRTYSSGMVVRLGFSIAVNVRPEVLILDEVIAVGDIHFQKKCMDRVYRFREEGKTILLVSHSMATIREMSDRVLWLRDGRVAGLGDPIPVIHEYEDYERAKETAERRQVEGYLVERGNRPLPRFTEVQVLRSATGTPPEVVAPGEALEVRMRYEWPDREVRAGLAVSLVRNDGVLVAAASTRHEGVSLSPSGTAVFRIPAFPFLAGQYAFSVYLVDEGALIYDQRLNQGGFRVSYDGWQVGLAPLEHAWEFPQASEARR